MIHSYQYRNECKWKTGTAILGKEGRATASNILSRKRAKNKIYSAAFVFLKWSVLALQMAD